MGLLGWLFGERGLGVDELGRRLGIEPQKLLGFKPAYREFTIPKRRGRGQRTILAPDDATKWLQRQILRRLLNRLRVHPAATGFERDQSIVSNARPHVGKGVVVRLDLVNFFQSTSEKRVLAWFRAIGWNRPAAKLLGKLCLWQGGLPQGAPTSPRLSNLVNYRLDARLAATAARLGASYTRYADDITFSLNEANSQQVQRLITITRILAADEGYRVHRRRKLHVRRRHHQQRVTGLVVNEKLNLPRRTRRWLRAVEHRAAQPHASRPPTLTSEQLAGWRALQGMVSNPDHQ